MKYHNLENSIFDVKNSYPCIQKQRAARLSNLRRDCTLYFTGHYPPVRNFFVMIRTISPSSDNLQQGLNCTV